jgi:F-type H+-transporting ATPase subunit b
VSAGWITFAFETANFLLLAAALGWLFFRPVRAALERRRDEIAEEQRAASAAREQAESDRRAEAERRRAAEAELSALRERLAREAEAEKQALLAEGRAAIAREHARAEQELVALRRAQTRVLARDAVAAAHEIVRRLLAALKAPSLDELLIESACRDLRTLRAGGALTPIVIESAEPLGPALEVRLRAAAEADQASLRVDPSLIAGVRIISARGLVDASAAGLAAQAERLLVARIEAEEPRDG